MSNHPDRITAAFNQVKKDLRVLTDRRTYENLTQNQIIGGLTVLLLVVGIGAGIYLGQTSQELRQRAQVDPYCIPTGNACFPGSSPCCDGSGGQSGVCNSGICALEGGGTCAPFGACKGSNQLCCEGTAPAPDSSCADGFRCTEILGGGICVAVNDGSTCVGDLPGADCTRGGQQGKCGSVGGTAQDPVCTCVLNSVDTCTTNGGQCYFGISDCFNVGKENAPPNMSCPQNPDNPTFQRCCWDGPPATPRPTNTPVPVPTNTSVPTTPGQPTNTPVVVPTNTSVPIPTNTIRPTNTPGGPTDTPTPTLTPVIAPVCINIVMNNPSTTVDDTPPNPLDVVTFTCSAVSGATRYEFRVRLPNGSYIDIPTSLATVNVSQEYQIPFSGTFNAACRACATADPNSCSPWLN